MFRLDLFDEQGVGGVGRGGGVVGGPGVGGVGVVGLFDMELALCMTTL